MREIHARGRGAPRPFYDLSDDEEVDEDDDPDDDPDDGLDEPFDEPPPPAL